MSSTPDHYSREDFDRDAGRLLELVDQMVEARLAAAFEEFATAVNSAVDDLANNVGDAFTAEAEARQRQLEQLATSINDALAVERQIAAGAAHALDAYGRRVLDSELSSVRADVAALRAQEVTTSLADVATALLASQAAQRPARAVVRTVHRDQHGDIEAIVETPLEDDLADQGDDLGPAAA